MKRLISLLFALCLLLSGTAAFADTGVTVYTSRDGLTMNTPGVYATLTNQWGMLYSGPGTDYTNVGTFDWNRTQVHCLTLAYDQYGDTWVLVDYDEPYLSWRGYVRLSEFSASDRQFLLSTLPYEYSYDQLTPLMLAMLYFSCDGLYGPGEDYLEMQSLDYRSTTGTIILASDEWALLELHPDTIRDMGLYAKCRVWVELSNLMY